MWPPALLLVCLWPRSARGADAYCSAAHAQLCRGKGTHVGCQYPQPGPGDACSNYTNINFNNGLADFVTDFINSHRQTIASGNERVKDDAVVPEPATVMLVEWDDELAFLAQRLAEQCLFMHDHCRATTRYPFAGQAVGEARARSPDLDLDPQRAVVRILEAWWVEREHVTAEQLFRPFALSQSGNIWGHFTQLAVWSLRAVGCGAVRHGAPAAVLLVCDFSHTNMLGQSTLRRGPEAPCPPGTARLHLSYAGLCAPIPTEQRLKGWPTRKCDYADNVPESRHVTHASLSEAPPLDIRQEYPLEYIPVVTPKPLRRSTRVRLDYEGVNVEQKRMPPSQEYLHSKIIVLENHVRTLMKKLPRDEEESTTQDIREFFNKLLRDGRKSSSCDAPRRGSETDAPRWESGDPGYQGRAMQPLRPPAAARGSERPFDRFQQTWKFTTEMTTVTSKKPAAPFSMNSEDAKQLFLDTGFRILSEQNISTHHFVV